jgi:glycerophosphoryl diester phosphodiesterase family protein
MDINLKLNPKEILAKRVPSMPDLAEKFPGVEPAKRLVSKSMDSVKNLLRDVKEEVPLPRDVDFGGLGRGLVEDFSIDKFLGGVGSLFKPREPRATNTSGSRIPGGPELYDKGGMYHKGAPGAPDTYAFENTPEGIKFAADHGYESIDLDMLITKDGVPVGTHYTEPMKKDGFYDPLRKLDQDTKVSEMTFAEVTRLRNEDGQSRIYPMTTMIEELKKNGIAGDLEAKDDSRFATDEVMGQLAGQVRDAGIRANLKSIDRGSRSFDNLESAQKHGFWVRTAAGNNRKGRHFGYGKTASD